MKKVTIAVLVIIAGFALAGVAAAAHHEPSVDKGKALFNDSKLGSTGKSCNDCHQNGKGVEKAAGRKDLDSVVNTCITKGLQGKALDVKSPEMQSLIMYINSFGGQKKDAKKPLVGC